METEKEERNRRGRQTIRRDMATTHQGSLGLGLRKDVVEKKNTFSFFFLSLVLILLREREAGRKEDNDK